MEGYIGEIRMFASNFSPRNWAYCNGQLLSIAANQALFAILGVTYGGDGRTTFALPDMRSRSAVSPGSNPGTLNYILGTKVGSETTTLISTNLPQHTHSLTGTPTVAIAPRCNTGAGDSPEAGTQYPAVPTTITPPYTTATPDVPVASMPVPATLNIMGANNGGSRPLLHLSPYTVVNYIICMYGIFPSRN
jgi:microcystin-dependent protein